MKTQAFLTLVMMIAGSAGCMRNQPPRSPISRVIETSYESEPSAPPREVLWEARIAGGTGLAPFDYVLVEKFSIEKVVIESWRLDEKAAETIWRIDHEAKSELLQKVLIEKLGSAGKNATGDAGAIPRGAHYLTLTGSFTEIAPGSRGLRFGLGFGLGQSRVVLDVRADRVIEGRSEARASIKVGYRKPGGEFGGNSSKLIDECLGACAQRITDYLCAP